MVLILTWYNILFFIEVGICYLVIPVEPNLYLKIHFIYKFLIIIPRLQEFTIGDTAIAQNLRRNSKRQLGFHVNYEGIVMDVEQKGTTLQLGKLNRGCRLVEVSYIKSIRILYFCSGIM